MALNNRRVPPVLESVLNRVPGGVHVFFMRSRGCFQREKLDPDTHAILLTRAMIESIA
jgi:hypothetical protein